MYMTGTQSDVTGRQAALAGLWAPCAISIIMVALRIWIRTVVRKSFGSDDVLIVFAVVAIIANDIVCTLAIDHGWLRHQESLTKGEFRTTMKLMVGVEITSLVTPTLIKLSVCCSILRIVSTARRAVSVTMWALMSVLVLSGLATMIVLCLQCIPMSKLWTSMPGGHCIGTNPTVGVYQGNAAISALTDFASAIIPIAILWNLQMSRATKIAVGALGGLAILPGIFGILKAVDVGEIRGEDVSYNMKGISTWLGAEMHSGLIIASLPMLWFPVSDWLSKHWSSWTRFVRSTARSKGVQRLDSSEEIPQSSTVHGTTAHGDSVKLQQYKRHSLSNEEELGGNTDLVIKRTDEIQVFPSQRNRSESFLGLADEERRLGIQWQKT